MQIEKLKTEQLIPSDYNPRKDLKPGDAEYDKLKRSIEQFGYVEPAIWNKTTGRVVGGHQRLKVLIDMPFADGIDKEWITSLFNRLRFRGAPHRKRA